MGILDEAIREHLDLKRRRGATDSELQRLEDEAFGPPSRPGEPDFPEQEGESAEQSGNGVAREGAVAEAPVAPEAPIPPPAEGEQVEQPDDPYEPHKPDAAEEETAIYDEAASEPPIETLDTVEHELPEHESEPEPPPEGPDSELAEEPEPSEQEPGAAAEGEETSEEDESHQEEDVLADTPDFLRDAPEDDELWFEQGKPKDFDF